jgi:hypothetical protein
MRSDNTVGSAHTQSPQLLFAPERRKRIARAQLAWMMEDLDDDRRFGNWPILLCRHSPVDGVPYWKVMEIDDWDGLEFFLEGHGCEYFFSYKWSDRKLWRKLKVGWWTTDKSIDEWGSLIIRPQTEVDWDKALSEEFARAAAAKGAVSSKMRRKPEYEDSKKLTDRSDYMWLITYLMMKRDCTATEMAAVLWHSEMSKDRRNDRDFSGRYVRTDRQERRWIEDEIKRRFRKGMKRKP